MTYILGISCYYHDSAACLLKDGIIIAAAEEERFSRKKHDNSFPINAIKFCLNFAKINQKQVAYMGFYEKPMLKFDRILSNAIINYPYAFFQFRKAVPEWLTEKLRLPTTIRKKLKYMGKIVFIDHHLSHAASSYYLSGFNDAAIITADGIGEWNSTAIFHGKGNQIMPLKSIKYPHSLGLFYSTITSFLGFKVNNDEYKIMGLAAYGKPSYYEKLKKLIDFKQDGSFKLDMSYFAYGYKERMYSNKFIRKFGIPRKPFGKVTKRDEDMAFSCQKIAEEIMMNMAEYARKLTKSDNLCIAGGVGLNSKANGVLLMQSKYKDVFFMPVAGDDGGAVGVAKYIWHSILNKKEKETLTRLDYGPEYQDEEIEEFLNKSKIKYSIFSEDELPRITAKLIFENKIIGWFQGRLELGPRALGNRSILANATNPEMKDIVNIKVKHREEFRPFAPVVLEEKAKEYFELKKDAPFMIYTTYAKNGKTPATTHVDGTSRPQTVNSKISPRYYKVIEEFEKLSGVPVILNTSFNVMGMPIVCTPKDAYECFIGTDIDVLIMGRYMVERKKIALKEK